MKIARLKSIRVFVSLLFFLLVFYLFLDISDTVTTKGSGYILYLQFIPSLIKFITLLSFAAAGFIIVLLLTLLFGRVYCSSICPLGTLQDIISYISNRKKKAGNFEFQKPYNILRYSILVITILLFLLGSMFAVTLLDPYSNFGRIISYLIRPIFLFLNNSAAFTLEQFDIYLIYPIEFSGIHLETLIIPVITLVLIVWLSITKGRLFCNTVCPVGTLLGFLSKYSLFKIVIDEDYCSSCGICETVCKAGCIDSEEKFLDFTRCVSCYNCFTVCPTNGFKYELSLPVKKGKRSSELNYNKREFVIQTFLYTLGLAGLSYAQQKIQVYKKNTVRVFRLSAISPPGSISIDHFTNACTACNLCVTSCPTQVLQPSFLEYGFLGMLQPRMDNIKGYCNYDCTICTEVCPTGAILPVQSEQKKLIQIGKSKFIKENCIVETQKTECGACVEHCPTKAVYMVPYNNLMIPEVNEEICTGCGTCEFACPTIPYKAIYVEGNPVHLLAKKPELKPVEKEVDLEEDFPF